MSTAQTTPSVPLWRLYVLRVGYALNFVFLGASAWPLLLHHPAPWDPTKGVAVAFWATLSLLAGLGIRYPLKMIPLLLTQFSYKAIWLAAVYWPMRAQGPWELTPVMAGGVVFDVLIIPWLYVLREYALARGDRWR
jgi:hypothetical protein